MLLQVAIFHYHNLGVAYAQSEVTASASASIPCLDKLGQDKWGCMVFKVTH